MPSCTAITVPTLAVEVVSAPKPAMFCSMMALISSAQDAIVIPPSDSWCFVIYYLLLARWGFRAKRRKNRGYPASRQGRLPPGPHLGAILYTGTRDGGGRRCGRFAGAVCRRGFRSEKIQIRAGDAGQQSLLEGCQTI